MVASFEHARPFHRPKVGHILNNANLANGPLFRGANVADIGGADIAAVQAFAGGGPYAVHRFGQGDQHEATLFDQMQDGSPR